MTRTDLLVPALDAAMTWLAQLQDSRMLLGIAGPPGAGKSTLAEALAEAINQRIGYDAAAAPAARGVPGAAVVAPMDGFHLANVELRRLGLTQRKGAPETFDAAGFVHLLRRLRIPDADIVYAPVYSRELHESIGAAVPVTPDVRVVVVEGNYLLLRTEPWIQVRRLLHHVIYLDAPETVRRAALVRRQRSRGLDTASAEDWVATSDEVNARLVATTRDRADLVLSRNPRVPS